MYVRPWLDAFEVGLSEGEANLARDPALKPLLTPGVHRSDSIGPLFATEAAAQSFIDALEIGREIGNGEGYLRCADENGVENFEDELLEARQKGIEEGRRLALVGRD